MRTTIFIMSLCFFCQTSIASKPTILFPNACSSGSSIIIAAVGDVLLHKPLQRMAWQNGFESLWREALPYIQAADIAYANLEGPIAPGITDSGKEIFGANATNQQVYTSYPAFNYPPALASTLKKNGFDIVSTANNHALDRLSIGIDKTIKTLNNVDLLFTGTRRKSSNENWYKIIEKKKIKVAWMACTDNINGYLDKYHQILSCYKKQDLQEMIKTIQKLRHQVDAIIVSPHWGEQYEIQPKAAQVQFAHRVLEAGATAVIGSHPHVLQPLQKYITQDGRSTLIMYSLGNFVSYQGGSRNRTTVILLIGLTKTKQATVINGVRFVPMYMQNRGNLGKIYLMRLPETETTLGHTIISQVLPMGNIWYSTSIRTNPECLNRNLADHR